MAGASEQARRTSAKPTFPPGGSGSTPGLERRQAARRLGSTKTGARAHEVTAAKQPFAACGNLRPLEYKPCCDGMRRQLEFRCTDHDGLSEYPDSLVVLRENPNRFGIRVHDGGSSSIAIRYCPGCGKSLQ
jgi:hypothetical protein